MKYKIWLDMDTGVDDAIALMAASADERLEILAVSAVCGNCPLEHSYRNTRALNKVMNRRYPVYAGADKPLLRAPMHAPIVHGENGLGDVELPLPEDETVYEEKAWDALYAAACKEPLTLIATGPLTNIAIAFRKYPDLPEKLAGFHIMGGSAVYGNVSPAAEFNILADPDAAKIVFDACRDKVKIVMCGLDVTEKPVLYPEDIEELKQAGSSKGGLIEKITGKAFEFHKMYGRRGLNVHDFIPILYLVRPELFTAKPAGVAVETRSALSVGKTVTDLESDKKFGFVNAMVVLDTKPEEVIGELKRLLK